VLRPRVELTEVCLRGAAGLYELIRVQIEQTAKASYNAIRQLQN